MAWLTSTLEAGRYADTWQVLAAGRQQGLADPRQAGSTCCAPCRVLCLSQMVAAYFRFPLGVYALTTARSTSTLQISRRLHRGIEFEAVSITSSSPPSFASPILHRNLDVSIQQPNMPSQEAAGSNPAPGPSSGAADRQAQDAQGAGATSPPRTEQELAQVRTRKSETSPSKSSMVKHSHSAIFHNHVFASPPSWLPWTIHTPVRGAPFRFLPRP